MTMQIKDHPSLVIAGIWNLAILTPDWFYSEFSDLTEDKQGEAEVQIGTGVMRFPFGGVMINPTTQKLILTATKEEAQQYEIIEKIAHGIVSKLHYTPVTGIGHNVSYLIDNNTKELNDDLFEKQEQSYQRQLKAVALDKLESGYSLSFEHYTLNLTYSMSREEKFVHINYHYPCNQEQDLTRFIKEFSVHTLQSKEMVKGLLA
ncbi:MAG: hypothetical protein H8D23_01950 [Candidatus Brocadiales bacterium]|nr:hypothetical protein [Candidatus Brocadiales bacterium]